MKHPSLNLKSFTVKEDAAFRLRVESWNPIAPADILAINFIQECLNKDGGVDFFSTYNYTLTKEELNTLCKELQKL
jgi:hypothetical protein